MSNTTGGYAQLDVGTIYYEVAGDGAPLVLGHAGFVDSRMWDDQWRSLAARFRVVRYDMRGYGRSGPLDGPINRRAELMQLLAHLGIARATLVGCSLSGEAMLDVAIERPGLVAALVVVSAVPSGFALQGAPPRYLMEMFAAIGQGDHELASELMNRIWVDGPFREPGEVDPQVRAHAAVMNRAALANGALLQPPGSPLDPPAAQRLDAVQAPTLIIAGALDHPEILRAADVMAHTIPQVQQRILPGCAHLPNMERPAEFDRLLLEFL